MIDSFSGEYAFLSNFYVSPFCVSGAEWPTVEHYYQSRKTLDEGIRDIIRSCETPGQAKRIGRAIPLPSYWESMRLLVMTESLCLKFLEHDKLRTALKLTGDQLLVEGNNWHDNYWGNCTCRYCADIEGENQLGKLLMELRDKVNGC